MSEPDTIPAEPAAPAAVGIEHKNPVSAAIAHLNLTQLTLIVVIVLFAWQWLDSKQQFAQMQQTLAQKLAEFDGNNKATQLLTQQNQELVRELGGKLSLLESKYAETQSQRSALESLYHDLSSSHDQMVLAEVEQLLLVANQQLQLSANVKAALIAMQQADARLQRLNRHALSGLRNTLNRDMDKLRSVPSTDLSVINGRIEYLIDNTDRLMLLQEIRIEQKDLPPAAQVADSTWAKLLQDIWQDLRQMVRIENIEQNDIPLLAPTQAFFLRENLKLRLLSARLELLSRDEASFKRDIRIAQQWLKEYFDTKSPEGAQAVSTLQKLVNSTIRIEMPDISNSLEAVRQYRASREKEAR